MLKNNKKIFDMGSNSYKIQNVLIPCDPPESELKKFLDEFSDRMYRASGRIISIGDDGIQRT